MVSCRHVEDVGSTTRVISFVRRRYHPRRAHLWIGECSFVSVMHLGNKIPLRRTNEIFTRLWMAKPGTKVLRVLPYCLATIALSISCFCYRLHLLPEFVYRFLNYYATPDSDITFTWNKATTGAIISRLSHILQVKQGFHREDLAEVSLFNHRIETDIVHAASRSVFSFIFATKNSHLTKIISSIILR